ncbi:DNA mismatch repair endonuclease MutL [Patescibacteria group bacterium]
MISVLDNNLINKIAAGEVVDRPASVVKELVENSLDAKADFVTVNLKNGGMDFIEIIDNGNGMNKRDAKLSVERHATSKIKELNDLSNICSFGFRGEALSAISSVSIFSLQTKEKGAISGASVKQSSVSVSSWAVEDVGCSEGTRIRIENLFHNVPARRKFLKSATTEFNHILNALIEIALVNYNVRFKLSHNDRVVFDYQASQWKDRVKIILGNDNFSNMVYFNRESGEMAIQGFVSIPTIVKMYKSNQYLFVNNRPIFNNIVNKAIYEGYRNLIPKGSYPMFVIKLDLEPELVDVNVHPRKQEVKFLKQQDVFRTVQAVIKEAVNSENKSAFYNSSFSESSSSLNNLGVNDKPLVEQLENKKFEIPSQKQIISKEFNYGYKKIISANLNNKISKFNEDMFFDKVKGQKKDNLNWKLVGQIKNLYLLVESEQGIVLVDQHAAHERMLYDKIKSNAENENCKSQQLLSPIKLELSANEMEIFKKNLKYLEKIGFEIEVFSLNTIIVQGIPQDISNQNIEEIFKGIISDFISDCGNDLASNEISLEECRDKVISYLACRGAVKAGNSLSFNEQFDLAGKVINEEIKSTCPHGRPIMTILTWHTLEKMFKRV